MIAVSLKLKEDILKDIESNISKLHKSRNRYINEALQFYNEKVQREIIAKQLEEESKLFREESMKILKEFEKFDDTKY